eukprot:COSAG02_NODE_461_length_21848_cov_235.681043_1_plen_80_part_00
MICQTVPAPEPEPEPEPETEAIQADQAVHADGAGDDLSGVVSYAVSSLIEQIDKPIDEAKSGDLKNLMQTVAGEGRRRT